jgi:hypothetical protein
VPVGDRACDIPTALTCVVTTGRFGATVGDADAELDVVPLITGWPAALVAPAVT